jgi:anti-sigma B factor antagonist
MRLKESVQEGIEIFALEGEIDLHYAPVLRSLFHAKIKAHAPVLVLDLAKVDYIDSSGLATIIEYFRDAAKHGGILCLTSLHENLKTAFQIVGLDRAIPAFETMDEAVAALKRGTIQPPSETLFKKSAA